MNRQARPARQIGALGFVCERLGVSDPAPPALNNKANESRELAETVQRSLARKLAAKNRTLKDLGVKQAPFVVLIGAVMPSVLAEISFVTNKQDGALLKTQAYRQQIAQALVDAIVDYQQSLKRMNAAAGKKATEQ